MLSSINVNGQPFASRSNLEKALRRMRNESQEITFWVDAICINQLDIDERSQQVELMGMIYKSARECILWLGEVEEQPIGPLQLFGSVNEAELRVLENLIQDLKLSTPEPLKNVSSGASINVLGAFEVMEWLAQDKHFHEMPFYQILPTGEIELSKQWHQAVYSLENIMRRSWWGRIWTVQEAFLAKHAAIHIGPYSLPYIIFLKGTRAWDTHVRQHCCSSILELWTGYATKRFESALNRILDLRRLQEAREKLRDETVARGLFRLSIQRSATLPHDKVYGLFGLITEFFELSDRPDYTKDLARLFSATTIKFMENAKNLCLLPYARPQHRELILSKHDLENQDNSAQQHQYLGELPTWTPDWSAKAWNDYFDFYNHAGFEADKLHTYDGTCQGDKILKLEGFAVDTISTVGPLIHDMEIPPSKIVPIVQMWLDGAKEKGLSNQAVWEVIHVATQKGVGLEKVKQQELWWETLKDLANKDATTQEMHDAAKGTEVQFCAASMTWLDKRATFTTEPVAESLDKVPNSEVSEYRSSWPKGSFGMALPNVREGDVIFIVKGGRTPFVFRPLSDPALRSQALEAGIPEQQLSECYNFVSICYTYGMMQGQAMVENPGWKHIYLL